MKKTSIFLVLVVLTICMAVSVLSSAKSTNKCSSCHSNFYQYLDILEGNAGNQLPTSINVGETKVITVSIENLINSPKYTTLTGATITLKSGSNLFTVISPTINIGNLPKGTKTVNWQITGVKAGVDTMEISAKATNNHMSLTLSDNYLPTPTINVVDVALPKKYVLTVLKPEGTGSINLAIGNYTYDENFNVSLIATPSQGYAFDQWVLDNSIVKANPTILKMDANHQIKAFFTPLIQYNLTIEVLDSQSLTPLVGVIVKAGIEQKNTDANGVTFFSTLSGFYNLTFEKLDYYPKTLTVNVTENTYIKFYLIPKNTTEPPIEPNYNVKLKIFDASTSLPISGTNITVGAAIGFTNENGDASFTLQKGSYLMCIEKTGYNSSNEIIEVSGNTTVNRFLSLNEVTPILQNNTKYEIKILIEDSSKSPIIEANVNLNNTQVTTDSNGVTTFNISIGKYFLEITKEGYSSYTCSFDVSSNVFIPITLNVLEQQTDDTGNNFRSQIINPLNLPISIVNYIAVFTFIICLAFRPRGSSFLFLVGLTGWAVSLSTLIIENVLLVINNENSLNVLWSLDNLLPFAIFASISCMLVALNKNRVPLSKNLAFLSISLIIINLPILFVAKIIYSTLLLPVILYELKYEKKLDTQNYKVWLTKFNHLVSWIFALITVISLFSGYALTKLQLSSIEMVQVHTILGYTFGIFLFGHIVFSVASAYPWINIIKTYVRGKRNLFNLVRLFQVCSSIALIFLGLIEFLSGLGYIDLSLVKYIPANIHIDWDTLFLAILILHGFVGVKVFATRNRVTIPGGDKLLIASTIVLLFYALRFAGL